MKIKEIIVESDDLDEGLWSTLRAGYQGAKASMAAASGMSSAAKNQAAALKKHQADSARLAKSWIDGWWKNANGLPDARLNDPTKYANEIVTYLKWLQHNDKFTVDSPPAITFNPPKTPPGPIKNDVNQESVEAFIKLAVDQKDVQPAETAPVVEKEPIWDQRAQVITYGDGRKFHRMTSPSKEPPPSSAVIPGTWEMTHKTGGTKLRTSIPQEEGANSQLDIRLNKINTAGL